MKKIIFSLLSIILLAGSLFAQTPKGFNYQAVVRNSAGQLMANRMVSVRINILQGTANGTSVYQQTDNVTTNGNGLFTLVVGENSTDFANINWSHGPYYIVSEVDPNGGNNYTLSTSQKILAVPYALHATEADRVSENFVYDEQDPRFRAWGFLYDSLRNAPTRLSQFINDLNFLTADDLHLTLHGDTLFLNNSTYVILPDHSTINLNPRVSGDTLFFNDNTYVILPTGTTGATTVEWDSVLNHPTYLSQFINDLQLYVSGDTLYFNNGTYVILPENGPTTIEWDSVLNHPTHLSQFVNDLQLSVSGDTLFFGDNTYIILPPTGPTTIEWDSVLNHPTLLSQFTNDLGFITAETQGLSDVIAINNYANGQIKNLSTPTDPMDAANKAYVDSVLAAEVAALNDRIDSITNVFEQRIDSINNRVFELEHPRIKGALPGIFSVSATKKVNFSQGNLQYRPRIKTWRFAVNQYDIAGSDNNNVYMQAYCSSWVDLFGYGTSGWDGGAGRFMPYETTTNNTEYTEATDGNDLIDFYANADWGFYNPIINGGNQTALWRTLTYSEWTYLLTQRPNAGQLQGMATVESTTGYIILPDDWTCPAGLSFVNTTSSYTINVYNASDWAAMEAAGAVFLPAAGIRVSSATSDIGIIGNYWTASHVNGTTGYSFHIEANQNVMQNTVTYSTGCSVRLVRDY